MCAVCGNEILVMNNKNAIIEKTCKLSCSHMYPLQNAFQRDGVAEVLLIVLASYLITVIIVSLSSLKPVTSVQARV